jgi:signal peptide peptidase SppA
MSKMQHGYPHIAARIFDTPLLIENSKLVTILQALGPRIGFDVEPMTLRAIDGDAGVKYQNPECHLNGMMQTSTEFEWRDEGHYVGNGVAVIPIIGSLVQRSDWMTSMSGMISYSHIERMVNAAMDDPEVREIVLEFDSPGGEVAGAFDLADRLASLRGKGKKITAIANEFAASAAYLLASAADEIAVPRTGMVGSIGVVAAHYDYSKALEKRGIAVTFVYAGEKKIEGNPYQPLSESAKKEWQDEIDGIYAMFVETVAKNRGMTAEKVRDTKAGMFTGAKAVEIGLANRVNTFSNELSNAVLRARNPAYAGQFFIQDDSRKEKDMSTVAEMEAKAKAEAEAKAKVEAEAKAKADAEAKAKEQSDADKVAAAVKAERERGNAIRALPEAKGREQLANELVNQGMSVEAAKAVLAAAPKASKLDDHMGNYSPSIGSDDPPEPQAPVAINPAGIYASRRQAVEKARAH